MTISRFLALMLAALLLTGASKTPSARDGYADSFLSDGKQNYPVKLYGVARDWNKACRSGKADLCLRLADAFVIGEGDLDADLRAAIGFYLMACDKGAALGCSTASAMAREGQAYTPIPTLSYETAAKGCALNDGDSCSAVALHLYRGDGVAQDKPRALTLWETACAARAATGCQLKAGALFYESGNAADQATAVALYQQGCAAKQGWGCSGLADAYARGQGTAQDMGQAASAARRGCIEASGDKVLACAIHARFLVQSGNPADVGLGTKLLTQSCLARVAAACNDAGLVAKRRPAGSAFASWEVALSFRDGCDQADGAACGHLGQLYAEGFDKIRVDLSRAVALYDKGCRLGDAASCQRVQALGSRADQARASKPAIDPAATADAQLAEASNFVKAGRGRDALLAVGRLMEEAVADAEWMMGGWYYYGEPGVVDAPNTRDGFILLDNAARQGHVEALKWVGMAYWEGTGVDVDQNKGLGYMQAAAQLGDRAAVAIARSMEYEPVRQANARRAAEMAAAAERQRTSWSSAFSNALANWSASSSSSYSSANNAASAASWQRYQSRVDSTNFNNYVSYVSGGTSACISSNPYCR